MRHIAYGIVLTALSLCPSAAAELSKPEGPVILTVGGSIAETNHGAEAQFDLDMLDALQQRTTATVTPWYEAEQSFSGVVMSDLLTSLGAKGTMVTVTALNDYSSEIPMEDLTEYPVILASRINGDPLSVRDKGPLFVIYPFDLSEELYNEVIFGRSVWQVKSITVH